MRHFVGYLLWLLIATLSLQGVAVAAVASHINLRQVTSVLHQTVDAAERSDETSIVHCCGDQNHHLASVQGECSRCASCCIGAATLPAIAKVIPPADLAVPVFAAPEPAMHLCVPAALERPPR